MIAAQCGEEVGVATGTHYVREPLFFREGIPVFSAGNAYVSNYDQIAAEHLRALAETGHNPWMPEAFWTQLEASTASHIRSHVPAGGRILDVGVGLGRLLGQFPQLERHGMDISFDYLKHAREKEIAVCLSLVEDMPYTEEFFDVVVCTDVLEHVLELNFAISNILKVLKTGGVLIARVPYREDLSAYIAPDFPFEFVHLRSFDIPALTLLFAKIFGCDVLEFSKAGYLCEAHRLDSSEEEARELGDLLPRLEKVAPDLYWDVLRRTHRPVEINVVVRKTDQSQRLPGVRKVASHPELDHCGHVFDRDERLRELTQQVAYLAERYRQGEAGQELLELQRRVEYLTPLAAKKPELEKTIEDLQAELAEMRRQRDALQESLSNRLARRLGGLLGLDR